MAGGRDRPYLTAEEVARLDPYGRRKPPLRQQAEALPAQDPRGGELVWWLGLWPSGGEVFWWATCVPATGPKATAAAPPLDAAAGELLWGRVDAEQTAGLLAELDAGLPTPRAGERNIAAVERAWAGALAQEPAELELARRLGSALLPPLLRERLTQAGRCRRPAHTVVVAAGPLLARIPWELLAVDPAGELRLVEAAWVRGGLPAAATTRRGRRPRPGWGPPVLRVLDPGPRGRGRLGSIYPDGLDPRWNDQEAEDDARLYPGDLGVPVTRDTLAERLAAGPRRFLYVGHAISGPAETPAAAALVLDDRDDRGAHQPLTAAAWLKQPHRWPMPERAAFVACQSDDTHHVEQMGLALAALNAGATLITCTRWTLPADDPATGRATTGLALAVDDAHDSADPIGALRDWQLDQLHAWRADPTARTAPLIWAAPVSYLAPDDDPADDPPAG